jgi:hypothetical protein
MLKQKSGAQKLALLVDGHKKFEDLKANLSTILARIQLVNC